MNGTRSFAFDDMVTKAGSEFLRGFGAWAHSPDEISRLVSDCRDRFHADRTYARLVLDHSYHHDNGFRKIVLFGFDNDVGQVRVHFWPAGSGMESNVHDHTRSYFSYVASGSLRVQHFVRGLGHWYRHHICRSEYDGTYQMRHIGSVELKCVADKILIEGDTHQGDSSLLHRTSAHSSAPVLTLFVQGRREKDVTNVFSDGVHSSGRTSARRIEARELVDTLATFGGSRC